jgi:hypothetical protein
MTTQKGKGKGKSRFPSGMTTKVGVTTRWEREATVGSDNKWEWGRGCSAFWDKVDFGGTFLFFLRTAGDNSKRLGGAKPQYFVPFAEKYLYSVPLRTDFLLTFWDVACHLRKLDKNTTKRVRSLLGFCGNRGWGRAVQPSFHLYSSQTLR